MKNLTQSLQESILDVETNINSANKSAEGYAKANQILLGLEEDLFKAKDLRYELKTDADAQPRNNWIRYTIQVQVPVGEVTKSYAPITDRYIAASTVKAIKTYYARLFSGFKSNMLEICRLISQPERFVKATKSNSLNDSYVYGGDLGINQILFSFKNGYLEVCLGTPFIPQFKDVMKKYGVVQGS